jgi:hypothetical protein
MPILRTGNVTSAPSRYEAGRGTKDVGVNECAYGATHTWHLFCVEKSKKPGKQPDPTGTSLSHNELR